MQVIIFLLLLFLFLFFALNWTRRTSRSKWPTRRQNSRSKILKKPIDFAVQAHVRSSLSPSEPFSVPSPYFVCSFSHSCPPVRLKTQLLCSRLQWPTTLVYHGQAAPVCLQRASDLRLRCRVASDESLGVHGYRSRLNRPATACPHVLSHHKCAGRAH